MVARWEKFGLAIMIIGIQVATMAADNGSTDFWNKLYGVFWGFKTPWPS